MKLDGLKQDFYLKLDKIRQEIKIILGDVSLTYERARSSLKDGKDLWGESGLTLPTRTN